MHDVTDAVDVTTARKGFLRIHVAGNRDLATVLPALRDSGRPLKESGKARVRRSGDWLVKESAGAAQARTLKHTFQRGRYRRAWQASLELRRRGVCVPEHIAYAEWGLAGVVTRNALITAYLARHRDVEATARSLIANGARQETFATFLRSLARAVNTLTEAGAYHADLSGKNIYTSDAESFCFIDLDAVQLDVPYDRDKRLKNHVQLYDSFCDMLSDRLLVPFIEAMLPDDIDIRVWMPTVRKAQEERRHKHEARQME